jgi:transposase
MARPSLFDAEFRARAVELAVSSSRPRSQVAADLGVSDATLYKWMSKAKPPQKPLSVDDDDAPLTESERAELKRLRKQQHEWAMEREILKKATAFFVKETGS